MSPCARAQQAKRDPAAFVAAIADRRKVGDGILPFEDLRCLLYIVEAASCRFVAAIADRGKVGGGILPSEEPGWLLYIVEEASCRFQVFGLLLRVSPRPGDLGGLPALAAQCARRAQGQRGRCPSTPMPVVAGSWSTRALAHFCAKFAIIRILVYKYSGDHQR